ncbi:MAG TPA: carbonic anhydrase [Kamptonema sp.]|nr:carbonic anhydrase [Kamptonema sp.]
MFNLSRGSILGGQYSGKGRRFFVKSLLSGAIAFTILQPTASAQAEELEAKALVLSCIDFRFLAAERYFLALQNLGNQYDWTALSGASLALAGFPSGADTQAFWDQLDLSYTIHHIKKVIILDHQDCGAYARKFDPDLSKDPERELQVHREYLNQAFWAIRQRYPELNIELYFVNLNTDVKPILPIDPPPKTNSLANSK